MINPRWDFEVDFPSDEYIKSLNGKQTQNLCITGFFKEIRSNRWNLHLSTGERSQWG